MIEKDEEDDEFFETIDKRVYPMALDLHLVNLKSSYVN